MTSAVPPERDGVRPEPAAVRPVRDAVLPERAGDETDEGWGDEPDEPERRLEHERPPHHDR